MKLKVPLLLVSLLLVSPMLSGCLTAQATALQYRDTAHARADEWDQDAVLAGIFGVEGTSTMGWMGPGVTWDWQWSGSTGFSGFGGGSSGMSAQGEVSKESYWARAEEDPNVGDGRAEFWVYAFVAEGRQEAFFVVVDRDGQVIDTGTAERDADMVPVGPWNVDSDRALEIAKDNNQGIEEGLDSENFGLMMALGRRNTSEHAKWLVVGGGGDSSGGGGGIVIIDAVTGEVLMSEGGFGGR